MKTRTHKSVIGQLRKKYGLKDNTPIHKVEQIMTPKDWQAFSEALTFQMVNQHKGVNDGHTTITSTNVYGFLLVCNCLNNQG